MSFVCSWRVSVRRKEGEPEVYGICNYKGPKGVRPKERDSLVILEPGVLEVYGEKVKCLAQQGVSQEDCFVDVLQQEEVRGYQRR